jgi:hypothetical protein
MTERELHVAARRALLDALEAAAAYRRSLIVVGAQAVYLRTERSTLALAPFTTDGDIVIDPSLLPSEPALEATLQAAGFRRSDQPGSWTTTIRVGSRDIDVAVDFMVPEAVAQGAGRRSVELEGHDRQAARRVFGLEAALVDHGPIRISAIDPSDTRCLTIAVAGPAALFIAKVHKIAERVGAGRHARTPVDKDAGDVYRLLQTTSVHDMAGGFRLALSAEVARPVAHLAVVRLNALFGRSTAAGVQMAVRAIGVTGESPDTIAAVLTGYTSALLTALAA